ncbi:MAG: DUF4332 domain-containing protein [Candidatus Bathyarchaeia archaeon]
MNYFVGALLTSFLFIGAVCYVVFSSEPLELPLYRFFRDFEEKLDANSEELLSSTDEALTKLGLKGFQSKESMQVLRDKVEGIEVRLKESGEKHEKSHDVSQKKLMDMERKLDGLQSVHKGVSSLERRLQVLEGVERDLKVIQGIVERVDSASKPFLSSTDGVDVLEGKMLKSGTVKQLKLSGMQKVEDLLLKGPVEIALSNAMSEGEAKSLQSVLQLLMIPGVQHEDAVLLLKSGVNSRQELALQETLSLGARISKTAELYVREGRIKECERPTLEEIASWIRLAKM